MMKDLLIGKAFAYTTDIGDASNINQYVNLILKWVLPIVGGLAVLMLIYAGYLYMTSQGNPETVGQAKDIIVGVIVGILLLFLIGIILSTIGIQ
jgi:hypothetical protein